MGGTSSSNNVTPYNLMITDENKPEIYDLIDLFGGGKLVDLAKDAILKNDFSELDQFILDTLPKYLYNDGKGQYIPIEKLMLYTIDPDDQQELIIANEKMKMKLSDDEYEKVIEAKKFVCFDVEKRGKIGETLLHLCFMNYSKVHDEIAKRMLLHFPNMINDICLSEDYWGETALHLAIVNEDPRMVRFLLMNGADVHQRCCGRFFIPEDQKAKRKVFISSEYPVLPKSTNYEGISYFAEYPLSFAAVLNQEECVRLLLAKNADPAKQDSNGNTVLHMLVIHDNLEMLKLIMDTKPCIYLKNNQDFTPLTLAIKLARKEIIEYVMENLRRVNWIYADISCAAYPLRNIDSIQENGEIDLNSALHLLANAEGEEHLELLEGFLVDLLNTKWKLYIRFKFYLQVIAFFIYFILTGVTILTKRIYFDYLNTTGCLENELELTKLEPYCKCAYLYPMDSNRYFRTIIEIIVVLYSLAYFLNTINEFYVQRLTYLKTMARNPTKITFLFSNLCILVIIPMRFTCNTYGEDILIVLAIIFMSSYVLYLGRGFRRTTTFVYVIHKVLGNSFVSFFLIDGIFIMGYSQAFYIVYNYGHYDWVEVIVFNNPLQCIFDTLLLSVGDILIPYENLLQTNYNIVGKILLATFLVLVTLLLSNMLIAMMLNTYDLTAECENEWLRQWAKQILAIEQNLNTKERLKQQKKYSQKLENGEIYFVVRWKQNHEEREEIMEDAWEYRENILHASDNHEYDDITVEDVEKEA